jgi:uncharacterized membrane protein SpoIIM required for sporulation
VNIDEFIEERKEEWDKLERVSDKMRTSRSSRGLDRDELWELGRLYTAAISDLALIRSSEFASDPDNEVVAYLNGLVMRVHGMIYRKPPFKWSSVLQFLVHGFPSALRKSSVYLLVSTSVFMLFFAAGFFTGLSEPGFLELLVPQRIISKVEGGEVWFQHLFAAAPQASGFLMTHNVSVTFLMIAAGLTFGLGTVYLLALNGLLLGSVAALCFKHGLSVEFWSFVLPHGSLELSAVFIAGAAGLILGHALIDPGPYRRADYLSVRGRLVARLALGCVPLLVIAGIIEAFFSPSPLPAWTKFIMAGLLFTSLLVFVAVSGGRSEEESDELTAGRRDPGKV